jgi:four helix bundle protein
MAYISEGFDRGRRAEFHQYLSMAKGSCGETRSHLYVAFDVGYIDEESFNELRQRCIDLSGLINRLRTNLGGWQATGGN